MTCDSCDLLRINGHVCHETGCRNSGKRWDAEREDWVRYVECRECGGEVEAGETCDCQEVAEYCEMCGGNVWPDSLVPCDCCGDDAA